MASPSVDAYGIRLLAEMDGGSEEPQESGRGHGKLKRDTATQLHLHYRCAALAGLLRWRAVPRNCAGKGQACTLLSVAVQMSVQFGRT